MVVITHILDEVTGNFLFPIAFMDRELRLDDLFKRDGVVYKVESVLLLLETHSHTDGSVDYDQPIAEVKVTVVP